MLTIRTTLDESVWREFLDRVQPHSFLSSWEWGTFHERVGHQIVRYGFFEGDTLRGVALAIHVQAKRGDSLLVPHGPIFDSTVDVREVFPLLISTLRNQAMLWKCVCVRICSLLSTTMENESMFIQAGFRSAPTHVHPELSWLVSLEPTEELLLAGMRKTSRQAVRKALEAGTTVRFSRDIQDIDVFWKIYQTTVSRQQFTPFSKSYLQKEFEVFQACNHAFIAIASVEGQDVSAAIIVEDHGSAYYHHGASTQAFPKVPASHLLQWEIMKEVKRSGRSWYNFWGIVREDQVKHPWFGLSVFKRGFGGMEESYLHAQDLPLSWKYWFMALIEDVRRRKRRL